MADEPAQNVFTFVANDLKPDTKLDIYRTEFEVHAVILRLYSGFFRRFLKEAVSVDQDSQSSFVYHLVVKDDEDIWGLQPYDKSIQSESERPDLKTRTMRIQAFQNLLEAFYRRLCAFESVDQLENLVAVADYYLALPAISSFVESNLLISTKMLRQIPEEAPRFLIAAHRFRSSSLFREAFIHVVGIWYQADAQRSTIEKTIGERLTGLVVTHHGNLCEKMNLLFRFSLSYHHNVFSFTKRKEEELVKEAIEISINQEDPFSSETDIHYCRHLHDAVINPSEKLVEDYRVAKARPKYEIHSLRRSLCQEVRKSIHKYTGPLLKNNLRFAGGGWDASATTFDHFLCTDLPEDQIPWDTTELDW